LSPLINLLITCRICRLADPLPGPPLLTGVPLGETHRIWHFANPLPVSASRELCVLSSWCNSTREGGPHCIHDLPCHKHPLLTGVPLGEYTPAVCRVPPFIPWPPVT
jgi:hypothetical protein